MTDIFVSYKREDQPRISPLFQALTNKGLKVWWDQDIGGGEAWRDRIEAALDAARCVIVVWSENSVGQAGGFVKDEASRGLRRNILLPVRIDKVSPPLGFGECQTLDLVGWRGNPSDALIRDVVAAAEAMVQQTPSPIQSWPGRRRRHRLITAIAAVLSVVVVLIALILALKPVERCFIWEESAETYSYAVRSSADPFADLSAARSNALDRAKKEAESMACPAPLGDIRKLVSAEIHPVTWQCTQHSDGHRCGFDGQVTCRYKNRKTAQGDACP